MPVRAEVSGRLAQALDGSGRFVVDYRYEFFRRRISKIVYQDLQGEEISQPRSRRFV